MACHPSAIFLGTDEKKKVGLKGVPRNCGMTRKEFHDTLYDDDCLITRNYNTFEFNKEAGKHCLVNKTKKSLNAAYSKMFGADNLVECTAWGSVKKYFFCTLSLNSNFKLSIFYFSRMRTFREFEIKRLNKFVENARDQDDEIRKIEAHNHKLVSFNWS